MATAGIAEEYLQSGWCARCGYKRTQRGNCPNCDHWYTHPLVTVGGTVAACLTLLLFIGIRAVRDADPQFEKLSRGLLSATPPPAITPVAAPVAPIAPPRFYQSVAPVSVSFANIPPPAIEKQAGRLEELRESVHFTERAYQISSTATPSLPGASLQTARNTAGTQAFSAIY